MRIHNTYVIDTLVQFYELSLVPELIHSYSKMMENVDNAENVLFHFTFSHQTYLEKVDWSYFEREHSICGFADMQIKFNALIRPLSSKYTVIVDYKSDGDPFYNIASSRRDVLYNYCNKVDLVVFGETDSMFPSQTLQLLDQLHESIKESTPKYIVNFADRRLWDNSFAPLHPKYENVPFIDDENWQFNSPDSGKGYMSYEQMEEINAIPFEDIKVVAFDEPRFDGSCVSFSSDLLKSGVQIPHGLIHHSEDVSLGKIAKKLLGDQFVQYNFSNILHIHNRRHPKKRTGILNETNPSGKCTEKDKGEWWKLLETASKYNYNNLFVQQPFVNVNEVLEQIKLSK